MSAQPLPPEPSSLEAWQVRTMTLDDIDAIMAIETRAYEFPWTKQNFVDSLNAGYIGLVIEDGEQRVVGYTVLMSAVDDLHILNLCVAPAAQGRGLGQRLLSQVRVVTLERGMHLILLEVRPSNTHAIRLYERFGFVEIGRRRNYYPARHQGREDAIVMRVKVKRLEGDHAR